MSIDVRLNKLMPALTAKERAMLVLRSLKDKTPEDPLWRRTMPREQAAEFSRLIVQMNACNIYLPLYITMVEQHVEQLWLRFYWWQTIVQFGLRVWKVAQLLPPGKRAKAETLVGDAFPLAELPWKPEEQEQSWLNVADDMEAGIRLWLVSLWEELRSIDILLDEVALDFDGEDPLRPVMRGVVEEARTRLTSLHELLSALDPLELKEPGEEELALARKYFDNGRRLMDNI